MEKMYQKIIKELEAQEVRLVCVSKTRSHEEIMSIYHQGQRIFGENRVQELVEKQESLPQDIEWHLIGSLQKNKVKYIAPFIHTIHSVDSLSLAEKIDLEAQKHGRIIKVLLQFKIASEISKQGFSFDESQKDIESIFELKNLQVCGVMGMASFVSEEQQIIEEFKSLKRIHTKLNVQYPFDYFKTISMGMSGDYSLAIECGSNMVRIGSLIFGNRY